MITEQLIRKQFINSIIRRDADFIFSTQAQVLRHNFTNPRANELANHLATRPFTISGEGLKPTYYFSIFPYLRFLDIKFSRDSGLRRRLALYNRVIWGRLYHETINDLRYGFTRDIHDTILHRFSQMDPSAL